MKPLLLLFGLLTLAVPGYSEGAPSRPFAKVPLQKVGGYQLRIYETFAYEKDLQKRTDLQLKDAVRCVAAVVSNSGKKTVVARYWALSWLTATGTDVKGDGTPDAIVEGYSGGAHCCWVYWFVSLGTKPETYQRLENERDIEIDQRHMGHTFLRTQDGAFDYFDGLCHACSPFPDVVLELRGRRLSDISSRFVAKYDQEIARAKHTFEHEDGEEFAALTDFRPAERELGGRYEDAQSAALTVVLAYLYSGREVQAWQSLDAMWPVSDRARMKELILKTRAKGILSQVGSAHRG